MKRHIRLTLGALLLSAIVAAPSAKARDYDDTDYWYSGRTLTVQPNMGIIPGTRVYYIQDASNYDLYRFGDTWYLVDRGEWYTSPSWRGPYASISLNVVPREVVTIPARYQRTWVGSSSDEYAAPKGHHFSTISFHKKPKMSKIPGTHVYYSRRATDYDLYRYHDHWYLVDDGVWYRANSWTGPFVRTKMKHVPDEVASIPLAYQHDWNVGTTYTGYTGDHVSYWRSGHTFEVQPTMNVIPHTDVFFTTDQTDYDLYWYGNSWYLADDGQWYRSDNWRGPFVSVSFNSVPSPVVGIPLSYRHYWNTPRPRRY